MSLGTKVPQKVRSATLVAAGMSLVALVLFAGLPPRPRILAVLNDAAHAPAFGAIALIVLALLRRALHRSGVWLIVAAFGISVIGGIGVEWLQSFLGRGSSWRDVGTDALGAACGLGLAGWWSVRSGAGLNHGWLRVLALTTALISGVLVLHPVAEAGLAYARRAALFPVLAGFDSPLDLYFTTTHSVSATRESLPAPWAPYGDGMSLRMRLLNGPWPGLTLTEPEHDWRAAAILKIDVTNPGTTALQLTVRVHDRAHNHRQKDRFNRVFSLQPHSRQTLSIPIAEIARGPAERELDLAQIAGVIVFVSDQEPAGVREIYLTRVWLD